jgi:hypothetical protein
MHTQADYDNEQRKQLLEHAQADAPGHLLLYAGTNMGVETLLGKKVQ